VDVQSIGDPPAPSTGEGTVEDLTCLVSGRTVVSNGFQSGQWLDRAGSPLTERARITEKFRRPDYGTLEIEMTIDDPEAYTRPWTIQLKQEIVLDTDLLDYICLENEKDSAHLVGAAK
jgi:hypothetical protein